MNADIWIHGEKLSCKADWKLCHLPAAFSSREQAAQKGKWAAICELSMETEPGEWVNLLKGLSAESAPSPPIDTSGN